MTIIDNTLPNVVHFKELEMGQVFKYKGDFFMKTDEREWSAVILSDGTLERFSDNDLCEPVEARLIIG